MISGPVYNDYNEHRDFTIIIYYKAVSGFCDTWSDIFLQVSIRGDLSLYRTSRTRQPTCAQLLCYAARFIILGIGTDWRTDSDHVFFNHFTQCKLSITRKIMDLTEIHHTSLTNLRRRQSTMVPDPKLHPHSS
jgi:hypothetical protein